MGLTGKGLALQHLGSEDGNRGKSVGTQVPHALNANDQMDDGNENIGAGAGQAGRRRALT